MIRFLLARFRKPKQPEPLTVSLNIRTAVFEFLCQYHHSKKGQHIRVYEPLADHPELVDRLIESYKNYREGATVDLNPDRPEDYAFLGAMQMFSFEDKIAALQKELEQ